MLKRLTEAFGVSGYENEVRNIIMEEINDLGVDITVDGMGNLIARKPSKVNPKGKTVFLCAHMDEVGFIVTDVTDEGYLKFNSVGGIDPKILVSKRVKIGEHFGVIGIKPIHLTDKEERKRPLTMDRLYVDIGAMDKAQALTVARRGDYFGFDSKYIEFGNMIKAKALDDRLGCAIMIDILKKDWNVNLVCAFTVQEEVGLRGARVAAREINPDFAVVIEGTTCNDMTGIPENLRVTKSGGGAAISVLDSASKADSGLRDMLIRVAEERGVPFQLKASTAGGNDAGAVHLADGGIKTATISVPCRYIHSPVSAMSKADFESCRKIVEGFLETLGEESGLCD